MLHVYCNYQCFIFHRKWNLSNCNHGMKKFSIIWTKYRFIQTLLPFSVICTYNNVIITKVTYFTVNKCWWNGEIETLLSIRAGHQVKETENKSLSIIFYKNDCPNEAHHCLTHFNALHLLYFDNSLWKLALKTLCKCVQNGLQIQYMHSVMISNSVIISNESDPQFSLHWCWLPENLRKTVNLDKTFLVHVCLSTEDPTSIWTLWTQKKSIWIHVN